MYHCVLLMKSITCRQNEFKRLWNTEVKMHNRVKHLEEMLESQDQKAGFATEIREAANVMKIFWSEARSLRLWLIT